MARELRLYLTTSVSTQSKRFFSKPPLTTSCLYRVVLSNRLQIEREYLLHSTYYAYTTYLILILM